MIKLIVELTDSVCDTNGNTHHFVKVTSTRTGNYIFFEDPHQNASDILSRAGVAWDEVYKVTETIKVSDWRRLNRHINPERLTRDDTVNRVRDLV